MKLKHHHYAIVAYVLSIAAGLLYSLWFLGYIYNPKAMDTLAVSALQTVGQPHYELFVAGDVATGLIVVLLVVCLVRLFQRTKQHKEINFYLCMIGLLAFGVMTAVSCLYPSCDSNSSYCVQNVSQVFDVHNVTGTIASLGQFMSVVTALILFHKKVSKTVNWTVLTLLILWAISGIIFISLSTASQSASLFMQHLFLVLSSILLVDVTWLLIKSNPSQVNN